MCKLIRLIDDSIVDFLVRDVEDVGQCNDHLQNSAPYSFHYCEFHCSRACFSEQGSYGLVCVEPLYYGQQVVLYGGKRSASNLGCKIPCLAFAKSEKALAVLEDDFQRPSLGINPVGLEEVKRQVCRDKSVPGSLLPGLAEISIIDNQAGGAILVVTANTYLGPELQCEMIKQLAPVNPVILGETVEHVFPATNHAA